MNAFVKGIFLLLALSAVFCVDLDGDGFDTDPANGRYQDCCDTVLDGCFDPFMVNPGAFEIPNNGILDRCTYDCSPSNGLRCENLDLESLPCDSNHIKTESYVLSGPQITSSDTEPAVWAMDLCEFKDDDDDPSWGFYRQSNMIFALADQTRLGFDIGVIGPDVLQASVLRSFGRIGPHNGDFMLAMSSGIAKARYQPNPVNGPPNHPSYAATSQTASLPSIWADNDGPSVNFGPNCDGSTKPTTGYDSILARFSVVQPSNMGAFSFKVLFLDAETGGVLDENNCGTTQSWFLAIKNGTYGVPTDGNFAIDKHNRAISSYNPNIDFFTQCSDWSGNYPDNTCPDSEIRLEGTNFDYASNWIPVGTSAKPKEVFELLLLTFDTANQLVDTTVLLDDFKVMGEPRATHGNANYLKDPYGYQYTADLAMVSLIPNVKGLYPANTNSITLNFVVRNEGPEVAGDVTIGFTPPFGTKYGSITLFTDCKINLASGDFVDNSYYKCKLANNEPLAPHQTLSGSLTFTVLTKAPKDLQFRLTASTSSIDYVWGNNHLVQLVYIDKPLGSSNPL